jgi:hypothetical protein
MLGAGCAQDRCIMVAALPLVANRTSSRTPASTRRPCPGGVGQEHPDLRVLLLASGSVYWRVTPTAHLLGSGLRKVLSHTLACLLNHREGNPRLCNSPTYLLRTRTPG